MNTKYEGNFIRILKYGEMKRMNIDECEIKYLQNVFEEFQRFCKELREDI